MHVEFEGVSVEALEAGSHIRDSDSGVEFFSGCGEAGTVVVDAEGEHAIRTGGEDADGASLIALCDAVFDGVFDHGLQDEQRHLCRQEFAGDVDAALQSLDEPDLLNVEILLRELEFFGQRYFLTIGVVEEPAHEIAQPDDHAYRLRRFSFREPDRRWS